MQEHEKRRSARLQERKEQWDLDAEEMVQDERPGPHTTLVNHPQQGERMDTTNSRGRSEMTLADIIYDHSNNTKPNRLSDDMFKQCVQLGYIDDKLLSLIIEKLQDYPMFLVWDSLIWKANI